MKKAFLWTGVILSLLALVVFIVPFGLPAQYHVERSVTINAQPAAIHPSVETPKEWPKWSAWTTEKYPDMKITYSGPDSGVGAIDEFEGESLGGGGKFEITKSHPDEGIEYKLEFHQGSSVMPSAGGIKYAKDGEGTKVTWTNEGELGLNPIARWCNAFGLMDSMMGPDFETGLAGLKKKVEAELAKAEKPPSEENLAGENLAEEAGTEKPSPTTADPPPPAGKPAKDR
jgi:hypothetical protein